MPKTKIEFLYFQGCPTYKKTLKDLQDIIKQNKLDVDLVKIKVKSDTEAQSFRFLGSPTIRINGVDIEPAAKESNDYKFACRIYRTPGGKSQGFPPKELIMKKLRLLT